MGMEFVRAEVGDLDGIMELYRRIIADTPDLYRYAKWKEGLHPSREGVRAYLESGDMYLLRQEGRGIAAMAVTMGQDENYDKVCWGIDGEAAVVHILGIHPDWQGKGIGRRMIDHAVQLARENGKRALRLDTLTTNLPAQHMYESKGFICRGKQTMYAENTGWIDFLFYEYILQPYQAGL